VSVEAISWAFQQPIKHSTAKFVLVAMASHADADMMCWPSTAHVCQLTGQDRKTVLENMKRLRDWGYIEDTGKRKGGTGSVPVYRLRNPENGTASDENSGRKNAEPIPKTEPLSDTENGTPLAASDPNIGTSSDGEAVPFFPPSSPVFPMKQSRFSHEAVPKTGHGTIKEPSRNHQGTKNIRETPDFDPTEELRKLGVADQAAKDWLKIRKAKNAPLTKTALNGLDREAKKAGLTLPEAVELCAERGWQALRAEWLKDKRAPSGHTTEDQRRAENEEAYRLLYGKKPSEVIDV